MKSLLNFIRTSLKPTPTPTIESYGQASNGVDQDQIQCITEWLFASLLNAGYLGKAHLLWDWGNQAWKMPIIVGIFRNEPIFLYRCGERPSPPPDNCYWRLMPEHPSLRIYQLEVREDDEGQV